MIESKVQYVLLLDGVIINCDQLKSFVPCILVPANQCQVCVETCALLI